MTRSHWKTGPVLVPCVLLLALCALTLTSVPAQAGQPTPSAPPPPVATPAQTGAEFVAGELIVSLRGAAEPTEVREIRELLERSADGRAQRLFTGLPGYTAIAARHPERSARASAESRARAEASLAALSNVYKLTLDPGTDVRSLAAELRRLPDVRYAEPNYILRLEFLPDDPFFSSSGSWSQDYDDLWGLKNISAEPAWDLATGAGVLVAVSDTGVDATHPEISNRMWTNPGETLNGIDDDSNGFIDDLGGWNFIGDNGDTTDDHGHGTHVSGTIAAEGDNGIGVIGVAFESTIMPVRCFDWTGRGTLEDGAASILYATAAGADVVNMSWGGTVDVETLRDAVVVAHGLGVMLVAAAGNSSANVESFFPAGYPEVMAVAALDHLDAPADFSNWGALLSVSAPGGDSEIPDDPLLTYNNVLSLKASGDVTMDNPVLIVDDVYYRARGTSMASPHATGVAALVRSYQPGLGNALVQVVMEASADDIGEPGFDMGTGHGRVNAYEALLLAGLAAARAELVAEVAVDTVTAAPGSPVAVSARVENIGSVDAAAVQLQIADGDPAMGGQVLYTWTVPLIPPGGAYQGTLTLALPSAGERNVFLVADPQQQIPEVSEENNRASAPVNVMSYQHVESVIADDEGLTPVGLFVEQRSPSISGNLVVWSDNRHSLVLNDGITDIYLLDVASGVETRITSAPSAKSDPCISGNRIVWIDRRNGYNDIYMYDLSTGLETQITSDTYSRAKPKVYGDWIVWSDRRNGNSDVFAYNVSGGGPEIQITTDPAEQSMPVVYGNRVVWCDTRSGSNDLYSYTLPSGPESPIVSGDGIRFGPDIHEDTVVWSEGYLNSLRDMDIGIHLLDLAQPPAVQLTSSPGAGDFYPSVSAADVAWTRGLLRPDVFVMDLATGYSSRLTTSGTATFSAVDTSEERAVWEEYRQMAWENEMLPRYDYNIYMAQRDAFPAAPLNLVAANGGTGTINLNWNDNTEGDLAGYRVYRRLSTQAPFTLVATTTLSAFQDTGLTDGIRYYYRVCAVDAAAGESAFSNEASAVPKTLTGGSPIFRKPIPNQQP